jgi:hypothetical protein
MGEIKKLHIILPRTYDRIDLLREAGRKGGDVIGIVLKSLQRKVGNLIHLAQDMAVCYHRHVSSSCIEG